MKFSISSSLRAALLLTVLASLINDLQAQVNHTHDVAPYCGYVAPANRTPRNGARTEEILQKVMPQSEAVEAAKKYKEMIVVAFYDQHILDDLKTHELRYLGQFYILQREFSQMFRNNGINLEVIIIPYRLDTQKHPDGGEVIRKLIPKQDKTFYDRDPKTNTMWAKFSRDIQEMGYDTQKLVLMSMARKVSYAGFAFADLKYLGISANSLNDDVTFMHEVLHLTWGHHGETKGSIENSGGMRVFQENNQWYFEESFLSNPYGGKAYKKANPGKVFHRSSSSYISGAPKSPINDYPLPDGTKEPRNVFRYFVSGNDAFTESNEMNTPRILNATVQAQDLVIDKQGTATLTLDLPKLYQQEGNSSVDSINVYFGLRQNILKQGAWVTDAFVTDVVGKKIAVSIDKNKRLYLRFDAKNPNINRGIAN